MHERKNYFIDRKFQVSFIIKNLVLLVFTFATVFLAISEWERHQVKQGFLLRPPTNSEVHVWAAAHDIQPGSAEYVQLFLSRAKVYTFFDLMWKPMTAVLLFNVIVLIAANIYYSHRIAGPVYRMKKVVQQKLDGQKVEPIRFRKDDEFQELADLVNRLMEKNDRIEN
jgi:nitrogen fixation/metabolism regulation signal transduction histidine kinase